MVQENITTETFEQRLGEEIASYAPPAPSNASAPTPPSPGPAPVPVPTPSTTPTLANAGKSIKTSAKRQDLEGRSRK